MSGGKAWWRASRRHKRSATGWLATRLPQVRGCDEHGCPGVCRSSSYVPQGCVGLCLHIIANVLHLPSLSSQRST